VFDVESAHRAWTSADIRERTKMSECRGSARLTLGSLVARWLEQRSFFGNGTCHRPPRAREGVGELRAI
jgi:hypothetical protein